jgi:hypothetical protein
MHGKTDERKGDKRAMKKFTKISLIVAGVLLGLGLVLGVVATALGAGFKTVLDMAEDGAFDHEFKNATLHIGPTGIYISGKDEANDTAADTAEDVSYNWDPTFEISKIELDADAADISFSESEDDAITVNLVHGVSRYFNATVEDGTLKISYENDSKGITVGIATKTAAKIEVALPAGCSLEELEVELNAGNLEVNVTDLSVQELSVEVNAANVSIDELQDVKNAELNANAGNIALSLAGAKTDYNYEITCGVGSITIADESFSSLDREETIRNEDALGEIEIECEVGKVAVSFTK